MVCDARRCDFRVLYNQLTRFYLRSGKLPHVAIIRGTVEMTKTTEQPPMVTAVRLEPLAGA